MDRSRYIGSTEIVALVEPESSPFCSPYSIWLEKTGLIERAAATERMNAGKYLERAILFEWNRRNDREMAFNDRPFFWDVDERIGATPDGLATDAALHEGAEVKTVTPEVRQYWDGGTPRYIWWQAQHEMLCANLDRVVVIAQFGFHRLAHEWIERDLDAGERIVKACNEMWRRIDGELPPPDPDSHPATTDALKRRESTAKAIELPPHVRDWSDNLGMIDRHIKELEEEAQGLKNKIRAAMGDASVGVWPDGTGWKIRNQPASEFVVKKKAHSVMVRINNKESIGADE